MGSERQEELPARQVSQLEARPQRLPDHVHHAQDREDGQVHGRPRGVRAPRGLPLSRFGSSRDEQLLPNQGEQRGKLYIIFQVEIFVDLDCIYVIKYSTPGHIKLIRFQKHEHLK